MAKKTNKPKLAPPKGKYSANQLTAILGTIQGIDVRKAAKDDESISGFTYGLGKNEERLEAELKRFRNDIEEYPKEQRDAYNEKVTELTIKHTGKNRRELEGKKVNIDKDIEDQAAYHADLDKLDEEFSDYIAERTAINKRNAAKSQEEYLDFEPYLINMYYVPHGMDLRPISMLIVEPEPQTTTKEKDHEQ